jgi:predicted nucleic acid-binding protein
MPIAVDAVTPIARRDSVIELARRYGFSACDASYLKPAIREGRTARTFDRDLAKAAKAAGVDVT